MIYSVPCECSNRLEVTAVQAGTEVACACGQQVRVPLLSQMRQVAGQAAYATSTIGLVNRMIRDGELPWGDLCAISYRPTSDHYILEVQYEFQKVKRIGSSGSPLFLILSLLTCFSPISLLFLLLNRSPRRETLRRFGHNRRIYLPLRVRKEYHDRFGRTRSQHKLRRWLRTVPVYDQLFREYPKAKIFT